MRSQHPVCYRIEATHGILTDNMGPLHYTGDIVAAEGACRIGGHTAEQLVYHLCTIVKISQKSHSIRRGNKSM
jgi:hypothetical protein